MLQSPCQPLYPCQIVHFRAILSIFVPNCPPLGVILSTFVLPSSFLPNSPSPSYDAPFVHCVGILSRHRLSEPPHPSSPALSCPLSSSFVLPSFIAYPLSFPSSAPLRPLSSCLTLAAVSASTASLSRLCMPIPAYHCLKWPILANKLAYVRIFAYLCGRFNLFLLAHEKEQAK